MVDSRVIDTIIAEAGGDVAGLQAVSAIINNRAQQWGLTPLQVVQQAGQFQGYSNPGSASKRAQLDAGVRSKAEKAFTDIATGRVADPTKGGLSFRSASAAKGMPAPHGTKTISGNTFALGNTPSSALSAINTVAPPIPRARPAPDASAYANSSVPTPPAGPVPYDFLGRGGRSVEINPNGTPKVPQPQMQVPPGAMYGVNRLPGHPQEPTDFQANLGAPYSSSPFSTDWQIANALRPTQDNRPSMVTAGNAGTPAAASGIASLFPAGLMASGGVGGPTSAFGGGSLAPNSFPAAAVPPPLPRPRPSNITTEGLTIRPVTSVAIDPMTGDPVGSNISRESPNLQTALNALAASKASSLGGSTKTTSNAAGSVPMPPGVVPKAAQTMLSQIAASQVNQSGSPDERGTYALPSIPKPLSAGPTPAQLAAINDVSHIPVPGGVINPSGVKVAAGNVIGKNTDQLSPTLAYGPPGSVPPSVAAINAATVPLPRPRPTPVVPTIPARPPAAYPLANIPNNGVNPFSQAGPNVASHVAQSGLGHIIQYLTGEPVQGGLLGMLPRLPAFASGAPAQSAANPQIPYPTVGTSFLQSQGQNTAGMTPAQISNALRDALASSSRQSGSGPGSQ